jgi:hypothetical protein
MVLEVALLDVKPGLEADFEAAFGTAQHIIASYDEWRRLLHHFYDPFPEVEHYELVHGAP